MANVGLPSNGAQFPSRADLAADLSPFVSEINSLGANQGYSTYDALNADWQAANQFYDANYDRITSPSFIAGANNPNASAPSNQDIVIFTDIPTSSTNYSRPRTLAAGYDASRQTMTVVFRDGTFYNYYDVKPNEWLNFSTSFSKGKPWLNRKNSLQAADGMFIGKPRGVADTTQLDPDLVAKLYTVARANQTANAPKRSRTDPTRVAGWEKKSGNKPFRRRSGYVPKPRKPKAP